MHPPHPAALADAPTDTRFGRSPTRRGTLCFAGRVVADLVAHASATAPEEACGFLYGTCGPAPLLATVTRAAPVTNSENVSRSVSFQIAPKEVRRAMAATYPRAIGYYHSHPSFSASASIEDRSGGWPGFVAVVIGLRDRDRPEIRAYQIESSGDSVRWEPLSVAVAMAGAAGGA